MPALRRKYALKDAGSGYGVIGRAALLMYHESLESVYNGRRIFRHGGVRVTSGENMSSLYCGSPHDGEFPLRRYTKTAVSDQAPRRAGRLGEMPAKHRIFRR